MIFCIIFYIIPQSKDFRKEAPILYAFMNNKQRKTKMHIYRF